MQIKRSVIVTAMLSVPTELSEVAMPSSAVRTFTDPDEYFAGTQHLLREGLVARRSEFFVEPTRIDR